MDNRVRYTEDWLKVNQLVQGRIYLVKDGRLLLYLGTSVNGLLIFYALASVYLEHTDGFVTYGNYDWQIQGLKVTINNILNHKGNKSSLLEYKGIPKLYGEFPFLKYEDSYKMWYIKSFDSDNTPNIANSIKEVNSGFVATKDLVPGNLYYSGECWRSCFVYLGRKSTKEYIWFYISNESTLVQSTARQLLYRSETTKNNKKVKPLQMCLTDKKAYVSSEVEYLVKINFKVNMNGITQEMLDSVR